MHDVDKQKFRLLVDIEKFSIYVNNLVENIPSKDFFYKDKIRNEMIEIYKCVVEMNELKTINDVDSFLEKNVTMQSSLSVISHMLEIIYKKKYINQKNLEKIIYNVNKIQKIIFVWKKNYLNGN